MSLLLRHALPVRCGIPNDRYGPAVRLVDCRARQSRRDALLATTSPLFLQLLGVKPAQADDMFDYFSRAFPPPPQPILYPRKQLGQTFAVLLMRSSYEAVDALDFIPMDSFQVKFWKFRQSQQEAYALQYSPVLKVRQGDLTDPLYFDFICWSQWSVIGQELPRGQQVFTEFCEECEDTGQRRVVRRDASLADNRLLPARFSQMVGDNVYSGLRDGFRGEQFGAPAACPRSAPIEELGSNLQRLLNILVDRGYAFKAQVTSLQAPGRTGLQQSAGSDLRSPDSATASEAIPITASASSLTGPEGGPDDRESGRLTVQTTGAATLWGVANLSFQRAPVAPAYDALLVDAYLRASGRRVTSYRLSYTDAGMDHEWTFV